MKNLKNIIFALALPLFMGFLFFAPHQASALGLIGKNQAEECSKNLSFIDIAHIECTVGTVNLVFTDDQPSDGDKRYQGLAQCSDKTDVISLGGGDKIDLSNVGKVVKTDTSSHIDYNSVRIFYSDPTKPGCQTYDTADRLSVGSTNNIAVLVKGESNRIANLDGVTKGSLSGISYDRYSRGDFDPDNGAALYSSSDLSLDKCSGGIMAVQTSGASGTQYILNPTNGTISASVDDLKNLPVNNCGITGQNFGFGNGTLSLSPAVTNIDKKIVGNACVASATAPSGYTCKCTTIPGIGAPICTLASTSTGGGGASSTNECPTDNIGDCNLSLLNSPNGPDSSACVANSHTTLEWLICPMMTAISKMADKINSFVENMLNFSVESTLPNCRDGADQNCGVNRAWSIIKNIVASLLVVIMLVMVISQAIGRGPFEAYTVKKILPRLVIAVILMQFSWVLTKYLITISNDLGTGIKQIMLAPFGGAGRLDLTSIMHHLNTGYPAATNWPVMFVMLALLVSFKDFILPLLIFLAVAVGSALFVALATLTFRNILIIMAVIFSPVALLLWILPGQTFQGYWKKYLDNFIKVLLLFPLVMATIYAGRIGAYLVGNTGWPSFINYIIVLIAYFGPMFYLPKTFKWGGSLLAGVNQAINTNKGLGTAKKWGYGLAKNTYDDKRLERQSRLSKSEPYLKREQMGTNRWYNKPGLTGWRKGIATPLRKATSKVGPDGKLEGRKSPINWSGNFTNLIPGGRVQTRGQGWRKAVAEGGEWKEHTDKENIEGNKRLFERGRKRELSSGAFYRDWASRKLGFAGFRKGKDMPYDPAAGSAALMSTIDNGEEPRGDKAAVKAFASDPSMTGTNMFNRIPLGAGSYKKLYRLRQGWEKKYGKTYGLSDEYDERKGSGDRKLELRMNALASLPTRTPAQRQELKELTGLNELRLGNMGRKPTRHQLAVADKHLKEARVRSKLHIEQPDADSPYANTAEDKRRNETLQLIPWAFHPTFQEEASALGSPTSQMLNQSAPFAKPDVLSHFTRPGRDLHPTQDVDSEPNNDFTINDEYNAFQDDYRDLGVDASTGEAAEKELAISLVEAKRNGDVGKVPERLQRTPHLFGVDKRLQKLFQGIKDGDSRVISWLTAKTGTSSTAIPVAIQMAEGTLNPNDLFRPEGFNPGVGSVLDQIARHPWKRAPYERMMATRWEMRRDMGFDDNNVEPETPRDLLIAITAHQLQNYDPTWTASELAQVFDEQIDANHPRQYKQATDEHGNPIDHYDPAIRARLGGLAAPPPRPPVSPTAMRHMQMRYQTGPTSTSGRTTPSRAAAIKRTVLPDDPAARAAASQEVYNAMTGLNTVPLPPQVLAAVEQAHNNFNDPVNLIDATKGPVYGNFRQDALREKMRVVKSAVTVALPGNEQFAREFASQIVARGIAGEAPAESGNDDISKLEAGLRVTMSQRNSGDQTQRQATIQKIFDTLGQIEQISGQRGVFSELPSLLAELNSPEGAPASVLSQVQASASTQVPPVATSTAPAAAPSTPSQQPSSQPQSQAATAPAAPAATPVYAAETVVAETQDPSQIRIQHSSETSGQISAAAARNISTAQPTVAMPVVIQSASPISFTPPPVSQVAPTIVNQTIVNKPAPVTMSNTTSGSAGEVASGLLHGNTSNTPTAGGLNLRGPQAEEFGFNVREGIVKALKPFAEAASRGEKIDPNKAATNVQKRVGDVIDDMNKR